MKRILTFIMAAVILLALGACSAKTQPEETQTVPETTAVPETTTVPETTEAPTEPTLPSFEECRVLTYYFQDTIPYRYYQRMAKIEVQEGTRIQLWIYDVPCYRGDAVRNLAPGDLLILGEREILVETVEINNIDEEGTYVINGGEGREGIWLRPFAFYNVETMRTETDYTPCNSSGWEHLVLTEERHTTLLDRLNLINTMEGPEDMTPDDFVKELEEYSDMLYLYNVMLDMVDGRLEGIYLLSGIDSQTNVSMIPDGNNPISPDRLQELMTGKE